MELRTATVFTTAFAAVTLLIKTSSLLFFTIPRRTVGRKFFSFYRLNTCFSDFKVQYSPAVTLPPVTLFSQQRYFELGPKKFELSYFSSFPPQLRYFELSYSPTVMLFLSLSIFFLFPLEFFCTLHFPTFFSFLNSSTILVI